MDVMWSGVVLCRQVWTRWTWMVWTEGLQHLVPSIPVPAHTWMALEGVHQVITGVDTDACMWAQVGASVLGPVHTPHQSDLGATSPARHPLVAPAVDDFPVCHIRDFPVASWFVMSEQPPSKRAHMSFHFDAQFRGSPLPSPLHPWGAAPLLSLDPIFGEK